MASLIYLKYMVNANFNERNKNRKTIFFNRLNTIIDKFGDENQYSLFDSKQSCTLTLFSLIFRFLLLFLSY